MKRKSHYIFNNLIKYVPRPQTKRWRVGPQSGAFDLFISLISCVQITTSDRVTRNTLIVATPGPERRCYTTPAAHETFLGGEPAEGSQVQHPVPIKAQRAADT